MATFDELRDIATTALGVPLRTRIQAAIAIKAHALVGGTPTATQLAWALEALENPASKVDMVMNYMLAAKESAAVSAITDATDTVIQTNTDNAVDTLIP